MVCVSTVKYKTKLSLTCKFPFVYKAYCCFRYVPRITPYYNALNVVVFDVDDNDEVEDRNSNADTNR